MQGAVACGSQREGSISGLRPDDGGGVAIAYVDAGGVGICLVGEVGCLAFEVGREVHEPQQFDGVADCLVLGCGLPPQSTGVGAAFMSPMTIVEASMAIWRYASARAWRKGSVASLKGSWALMTLSCYPSPTTSWTPRLPETLRWWTRWTWMPVRAYRGVPLCQ